MKIISIPGKYTYVTLLILLGFGIRLFYLSGHDISGDEPFSIFYSQKTVLDILGMAGYENNPPLHFLLLHFLIKFFGIEPFAVRLPSAVFSAATIFYLYRTGEKFFNFKTAVFSSLLYIFSTKSIYYAQEARAYAMLHFFTVASFYYFLALIKAPKRKKYFYFLLLSNMMMIYTHYIGLFVILTESVIVLLIDKSRFQKKLLRKKIIINFFILFLLFSPLVIFFIKRFMEYSDGGSWFGKPDLASLYDNIRKFSNAPVIAVAFILMILLWVIKKTKNVSGKFSIQIETCSGIIYFFFFFSYISMFIVSFFSPVFMERYVMFIAFAFYIMIAVSVQSLFKNRIIQSTLFLTGVLGMIYTVKLNPEKPNISEVVKKVNEIYRNDSNTALFICPPWQVLNFSYYYNKKYFMDYKNINSHLENEHIFPVYGSEQVSSLLSSKYNRIIFLQCGILYTDPKGEINGLLGRTYQNQKNYVAVEGYGITEYFN